MSWQELTKPNQASDVEAKGARRLRVAPILQRVSDDVDTGMDSPPRLHVVIQECRLPLKLPFGWRPIIVEESTSTILLLQHPSQ